MPHILGTLQFWVSLQGLWQPHSFDFAMLRLPSNSQGLEFPAYRLPKLQLCAYGLQWLILIVNLTGFESPRRCSSGCVCEDIARGSMWKRRSTLNDCCMIPQTKGP